MHHRIFVVFVALLVFGQSACAPADTRDDFGHAGTGITFNMGALTYPGAADVCYSFTVVNGLDQLVVGRGLATTITSTSRNPAYAAWGANTPYVQNASYTNGTPLICSTQFGNGPGGDWSYVAPCDASEDARAHTVTVWLDRFQAGTPPADLTANVDDQDPCPAGCSVPVTFQENTDTPVTFNFTIMRRANQGFFDIGVNFDNIFCSAKADCRADSDGNGVVSLDDEPLTLLHNADDVRDTTVVLGFACTGGPGADTYLHRDLVRITCGNEVFTFDPNQPPGNAGPLTSVPGGVPLVFETAVYWGTELLPTVNKAYWNIAIGIDEARLATLSDCVLTTHATFSDGPGVLPGGETPDGVIYPRVRWHVPLSDNGMLSCLNHPLDAGPEVATDYAPHAYHAYLAGGFNTGVDALIDGYAPTPRIIAGASTARVVLWSDGTLTSTSTTFPGASALLASYTDVSVAGQHGCAIRTDGSIGCFGADHAGSTIPPAGTDFVQVVAGAFQMGARRANGSVVGWGRARNGQLNIPAGVFTTISSYSYGFCGIVAEPNATRTLRCWGHDDTGIRSEVPSGGDYTDVVTGWNHACAMRTNGLVVCWGENTVQNMTPTQTVFKQLAPGHSTLHACGITEDDAIVCWGSNAQGQLNAPTGAFKKAFVGNMISCGIRMNDTMLCWGASTNTSLPGPP